MVTRRLLKFYENENLRKQLRKCKEVATPKLNNVALLRALRCMSCKDYAGERLSGVQIGRCGQRPWIADLVEQSLPPGILIHRRIRGDLGLEPLEVGHE